METRALPTREFRDALTGARVVRLTPGDTHALRNYFYQKAFSSDGTRLLFGWDASGDTELWLLDLVEHAARRLTRGGANVQGAFLAADDESAWFTRDARQLVRVDLEGREHVAYEVPAPWVGYGTWGANSAGTRVLALLMHADDRAAGEGWARFAAQFAAKPRQRLVEIDLATGRAEVLWEERRYLGHPMYRPGDDDLLGFCHEGPHDLVETRVWLLDRGGVPRPASRPVAGQAFMHEFWVPDGSRLLFVGYRPGVRERALWGYDPVAGTSAPVMPLPACAHLMGNHDGSLLVGDGAVSQGDLAGSDPTFEADPRLYLFEPGRGTRRTLGLHGSSWNTYGGNTQAAHPHPSFTPDGRQVLFASDFEGDLALYLVDVATDGSSLLS